MLNINTAFNPFTTQTVQLGAANPFLAANLNEQNFDYFAGTNQTDSFEEISPFAISNAPAEPSAVIEEFMMMEELMQQKEMKEAELQELQAAA